MTEDDLQAIGELFRKIIREELELCGIRPRSDPGAAERMRRYRAKKETVTRHVTRNAPEEKTVTVTARVTAKERNGHSAGAMVWLAYAEAYKARYSVDPVRNAKVNGQLAQLVKRLGDDAAPVAAWFLGHGAARYVSSGHTVGLMLVDCEKLHTEWQTGRRITATAAVQSDRTQANGDMWGRLIEEARHG